MNTNLIYKIKTYFSYKRTIVGIQFEGLIAVYYPLRKKCSHKCFLLFLLLILIISIAVNTQFIYITRITNLICYSFHPNINYLFFYISIHSILNTLIPNLTLIVINIIIIKKLNNVNERVNRVGNKSSSVITKKFIISSLVFVLIFLPLRLLNCYSILNSNYEDVYLIRKILSLLICFYYSLYFLIHIFIMTHIRSVFERMRNEREIKFYQNDL